MLLEQICGRSAEMSSRVAIRDERSALTYADLERESRRIATVIGATSLARGALVAIYQRRSASLVAAIVGVWRSAAAYTIVEADGVPQEHYRRLQTIAPDLVLTTQEHAAALRERGLRVATIDSPAVDDDPVGGFRANVPAVVETRCDVDPPSPDDLAYVLFTSGSTGVPKGVQVTHGNIAHYVEALLARLEIEPSLSYAHVSTMSADLGNTGLFLSLWTGGTLHVIGDECRKDPSALLTYLVKHGVHVLKITPSHWEAIFSLLRSDAAPVLALRYLILGGEALSAKLARTVLDSGVAQRVVNHYGPTETTIGITVYPMERGNAAALASLATVPIGRALGQTRLVVREGDRSYKALDAQGELYVGGPCVSAGYRNNPEANAKSFVTDVDGDQRFYRTGDIVRIDEAGVVQFIGRVDRQVKINGYRIELEHIERALKSLDGCEGAAAFATTIRERPAIAAAVLARGQRTVAAIKADLATILPGYMVPRELRIFDAFPLNPNGKTDLSRLRALLEREIAAAVPEETAKAQGTRDDVRDAVIVAWQRCLGNAEVDDDDDFFALGGDSLDAIEVIAQLQAAGYRVSARAFLRRPTVGALIESIRDCANDAYTPEAGHESEPHTIRFERMTAAQQVFLEQALNRPDHHNQALLFDIDGRTSPDILARALDLVCSWNPMLTARFETDGDSWAAHVDAGRGPHAVLSTSEIPMDLGPDATAAFVRRTCQALQASLRLTDGRLFAAHLFSRATGAGHLLLCAHHLAVDAVSWRIIVDDLTRIYGSLAVHGIEPPAPRSRSVWDWTAYLGSARSLDDDVAYWRQLPVALVDSRLNKRFDRNLERHARTIWLSFSRDQTASLLLNLPAKFDAPFHHILLAAYMAAFDEIAAGAGDANGYLVDVESHGRVTLEVEDGDEGDVDPSRTVGWLTSAYPVALSPAAGDLAESVKRIDATLAAVPHLGVAYGLHRAKLSEQWGGLPSAQHCYNYLGRFEYDGNAALKLAPSTLSPGFARGYDNDRGHEFRLTARVIEDQLICDLGYAGERHDTSTARSIMMRTASLLTEAADGAGALAPSARGAAPGPESERLDAGFETYAEAGSSAGLLVYRPAIFEAQRAHRAAGRDRARYEQVVVTGATGFVGAYVLRELLHRTGATVHCLVRGQTDVEAGARLASVFDGYFPATPLAGFGSRVRVVAGDVTQERLGLNKRTYEVLDLEADAVYHLAADTRLFASEEVLERQNVLGTRRAIELAGGRRPKDLHHMSTLAVCGVVQAGQQPVTFSETSFEIGQTFQNAYEKTKFAAETLVREFVSHGGRAFIYRSGNVSADSVNGRFQRNAGDNRFIQLVRAAMKLGCVPSRLEETIALSPVDCVARATIATSLGAASSGTVFHIDSPWEIAMADVFDVLSELGVHLEASASATFAELFRQGFGASDRDIALGYFWASRPPRGVKFDHSKTLRLLDDLNCGFERPTRNWLRTFMEHLLNTGALPRQSAIV